MILYHGSNVEVNSQELSSQIKRLILDPGFTPHQTMNRQKRVFYKNETHEKRQARNFIIQLL